MSNDRTLDLETLILLEGSHESPADGFCVMEAVAYVAGYLVHDVLLNNRWLGEVQDRARRFSFGTRDGRRLHVQLAALERCEYERTVTSAHGGGRPRMKGRMESYSVERALELQGLPPNWISDHTPFTRRGLVKALAQGVPLPMGRAVARAVMRAMYPERMEVSA